MYAINELKKVPNSFFAIIQIAFIIISFKKSPTLTPPRGGGAFGSSVIYTILLFVTLLF